MAHGSGPDGPVPDDTARASPDALRAELYLRELAERELRGTDEQPDSPLGPPDGPPPPAPAVHAVDRARIAAGALVAAGAIGEPVAAAVLSELVEALVVRSSLPAMHTYRNRFLPAAPRLPRSVPVPGPGLPGGPVRVVPIGQPVPFANSGGEEDRHLHLLTLTVAPSLAAVTYAGRAFGSGDGPGPAELPAGPIGPCGPSSTSSSLAFTDDHGTSYHVSISGGGTTDGTWWVSESSLTPVPPAGVRWMGISPASGAEALRVELDGSADAGFGAAADAGTRVRAEVTTRTPDSHWAGALPARGAPPAERLADSLAEDLLWSVLWTGSAERVRPELDGMLPALTGAGALAPGSPALARLAALAGRLGVRLPADLPAGLAGSAEATESAGSAQAVGPSPADIRLPEAWESVLAARDRRDGRVGLAPAAAVLPETDGAVFAITGLCSGERSLVLRVSGWGWPEPRTPSGRTARWYSWWARDNAGRWHVARRVGAPLSRSAGTDLAFAPPLHPAATSLEVILTGPSGRAVATMPIDWQPLP